MEIFYPEPTRFYRMHLTFKVFLHMSLPGLRKIIISNCIAMPCLLYLVWKRRLSQPRPVPPPPPPGLNVLVYLCIPYWFWRLRSFPTHRALLFIVSCIYSFIYFFISFPDFPLQLFVADPVIGVGSRLPPHPRPPTKNVAPPWTGFVNYTWITAIAIL